MNGELRIVPKIDLSSFEHRLVDRKIRLRNGILEEVDEMRPDKVGKADGLVLGSKSASARAAAVTDAVRADRQRLQGVWRLVSGSVGGRPGGPDGKLRWSVAGDRVVLEMGDRWVGASTLDPARSPKRIDIAAKSSDGTVEQIRGVYEVRGDRLCVCLAFGDDPRPENLRSSKGANQISLTLKRQP